MVRVLSLLLFVILFYNVVRNIVLIRCMNTTTNYLLCALPSLSSTTSFLQSLLSGSLLSNLAYLSTKCIKWSNTVTCIFALLTCRTAFSASSDFAAALSNGASPCYSNDGHESYKCKLELISFFSNVSCR